MSGYRDKALFKATPPGVLKRYSEIMEKRFGARWSARHIATEYGLPITIVHRILYRYKAPKTGRNVTLIITSKV